MWGRLAYDADLGRFTGPTIFLEAQRLGAPIRWGRSLGPEEELELERLRADGHRVVEERRGFVVESTLESVRRTQLYRTLPHELGHLEHVRAYEREGRLSDYWSIPHREREQYAHRFARELGEKLEGSRRIPFERTFDKRAWSVHEIAAGWFEA